MEKINTLSPFKYSNTNKRYYTYDYYLKSTFNDKVFKVSLDGGFSCPNRDGKISIGGCIFCNGDGSGEFAGNKLDSLDVQFEKIKKVMLRKWPNVTKIIAYFQAFTNTYDSVENLKKRFEPFINKKGVVGIDIATRPDCLDDDILDYLESISKRTKLWVELGLQTTYDKTAKLINRGYTYHTFLKAVNNLRARNINVTVHLINGLPYETRQMMITNVKRVSSLDIQGIKLHSLNILKNTKLASIYASNPFYVMSLDEYIDLVVDQIRHIKEDIVIQRISGDASEEELIAPTWSRNKTQLANNVDKLMVKLNAIQGDKYNLDPVTFCHELIAKLENKNKAIDATLGNGHDSLFLSKLFNSVISYDIQELAITRSKKLLKDINNVTLLHDSYVNFDKYNLTDIDLILYNLGYLPGSDKKIKTSSNDTIKSITKGLEILNNNGHIIVVSYTQHDNKNEYNDIKHYLDKNKIKYQEYDQFDYERIFDITK